MSAGGKGWAFYMSPVMLLADWSQVQYYQGYMLSDHEYALPNSNENAPLHVESAGSQKGLTYSRTRKRLTSPQVAGQLQPQGQKINIIVKRPSQIGTRRVTNTNSHEITMQSRSIRCWGFRTCLALEWYLCCSLHPALSGYTIAALVITSQKALVPSNSV